MSKHSARLLFLMFGTFLLALAMMPLSTVSAQPQFGANWVAQFYNNNNLSGSVVATANFPTGINANWGSGQPRDGANNVLTAVNADGFSARFTGTQSIPAGVYDFVTTSDDGVRLYIDGNLIINNFSGGGQRSSSARVNLTGGNYTIVLDYFEDTGNALVQLSWSIASSVTITPTGPTSTPVPIASGGVTGVRGSAIRTGPYLGASFIAVARPETALTFLARNRSEGVFTWYLVAFGEENSRQGWVSGRYLSITGTPQALPEQGSVFDTIDGAPDIGVRGQTRAAMNLRVRPSQRTAVLGQIPWGDTVIIVGRTVQGGKDFWYHVRWQDKLGWISAAYVGISAGDVRNVPVR